MTWSDPDPPGGVLAAKHGQPRPYNCHRRECHERVYRTDSGTEVCLEGHTQ